jgi:hypothetical protein
MYEWMNEPDFKEFEHAGLKCKIIRQAWSGHLCGYVQVPKDHVHYGVSYNDVEYEVHGGLTFSGFIKQDEDNYYFGFDCAHAWDICPERVEQGDYWPSDGVYRNIAYVENECRHLAAQIAANLNCIDEREKAFMKAYAEIKKECHSEVETCRRVWAAAVAWAGTK